MSCYLQVVVSVEAAPGAPGNRQLHLQPPRCAVLPVPLRVLVCLRCWLGPAWPGALSLNGEPLRVGCRLLHQRLAWAGASGRVQPSEAGLDPRGHLWVTWGVYLWAGKPPLADIILSHPPDLTSCDSVAARALAICRAQDRR